MDIHTCTDDREESLWHPTNTCTYMYQKCTMKYFPPVDYYKAVKAKIKQNSGLQLDMR